MSTTVIICYLAVAVALVVIFAQAYNISVLRAELRELSGRENRSSRDIERCINDSSILSNLRHDIETDGRKFVGYCDAIDVCLKYRDILRRNPDFETLNQEVLTQIENKRELTK